MGNSNDKGFSIICGYHEPKILYIKKNTQNNQEKFSLKLKSVLDQSKLKRAFNISFKTSNMDLENQVSYVKSIIL